MRHSFSDDAIVLRVYDVGETDRFCILLTRRHGRISARARGARKLNSRKGGSLLPLHTARVEIESKGESRFVAGASSVNPNARSWKDLAAFSAAEQAVELLMKLIEEGESVEDVYELTEGFLQACDGNRADDLFAAFTIKLLSLLGTMPSLTHSSVSQRPFSPSDQLSFNPVTGALSVRGEDPGARILSVDVVSLLRSFPSLALIQLPSLTPDAASQLRRLAHSLLGNQLGSALKTLPVPPGVMPT